MRIVLTRVGLAKACCYLFDYPRVYSPGQLVLLSDYPIQLPLLYLRLMSSRPITYRVYTSFILLFTIGNAPFVQANSRVWIARSGAYIQGKYHFLQTDSPSLGHTII